MFYIPRVTEYLDILTDEKVKHFVVIDFDKRFKYRRKEQHSKLNKNINIRTVAESFYTFLKVPDEVEKYNELIDKMEEAKIMIQVLLIIACASIVSRFSILLTLNYN